MHRQTRYENRSSRKHEEQMQISALHETSSGNRRLKQTLADSAFPMQHQNQDYFRARAFYQVYVFSSCLFQSLNTNPFQITFHFGVRLSSR